MTRLDRPAGAQWSTLTRRPGRNEFTSFSAEVKPLARVPFPVPSRPSLSGSRGTSGSRPRPNPGHARGSGNSGPTATVRRLVLERDGYACVCCGTSVIGRRYSLGHRLRASQGGKAVPSNLLTFLGLGGELCHGRIDARRDPADEDKGFTVRSFQDPALVPVMFFEPDGSGALVYLLDDGTVSATPPVGGAA